MSLLLFANNAQSTLAGPIAANATSLNLAAGTGSEFPSPAAGQYFVMTLNDQATKLIREIIWVTARSGDTCTILRGQEGTAAAAWLANDIAANWWTAGQAAAMIQVAQLQLQATNFAVDSGAVNALAVTLNPPPASLASLKGAPVRTTIANTNTGSTTLNVNGLGATLITNPDGTNLAGGQLLAGHVYEFNYNGSTFDLMSSPYQILKSANTFALIQTFSGGAALPNNVAIQSKDSGGTGHNVLFYGSDNNVYLQSGTSGVVILNSAGTTNLLRFDTSNNATFAAGISSAGFDAGGFNTRFQALNYGAGWRNDNVNTYLLLTNSGGTSFNALRPFTVQNSNGAVTIDGTGAGASSGGAFNAVGALTGLTVASNNGNVQANSGRLRATLGARGSGDNNAAALLLDFTSSLSGSGYQYLPSGLIFQWTTLGLPGNSTPTAYNYPIAFPNLSIFVNATYQANLPPTTGACGAQLNSNSQFTATNTASGGSNGTNIFAIGF